MLMGKTIATIAPEYLAGGTTDRHIELPRGELASILYGLTRDGQARYRFNDFIEALHDDGAGADVRFKSGAEQRFDIVIGADGVHSTHAPWCSGRKHRSSAILVFASTFFLKAEQCWPLT